MKIKKRIVFNGYEFNFISHGRIIVELKEKSKEELVKITNLLNDNYDKPRLKRGGHSRHGEFQLCSNQPECKNAVFRRNRGIKKGWNGYCSRSCSDKVVERFFKKGHPPYHKEKYYPGALVKDINPKSSVYGNIGAIVGVTRKKESKEIEVVRVRYNDDLPDIVRIYQQGLNLPHIVPYKEKVKKLMIGSFLKSEPIFLR